MSKLAFFDRLIVGHNFLSNLPQDRGDTFFSQCGLIGSLQNVRRFQKAQKEFFLVKVNIYIFLEEFSRCILSLK
jgi:hypothetical protein